MPSPRRCAGTHSCYGISANPGRPGRAAKVATCVWDRSRALLTRKRKRPPPRRQRERKRAPVPAPRGLLRRYAEMQAPLSQLKTSQNPPQKRMGDSQRRWRRLERPKCRPNPRKALEPSRLPRPRNPNRALHPPPLSARNWLVRIEVVDTLFCFSFLRLPTCRQSLSVFFAVHLADGTRRPRPTRIFYLVLNVPCMLHSISLLVFKVVIVFDLEPARRGVGTTGRRRLLNDEVIQLPLGRRRDLLQVQTRLAVLIRPHLVGRLKNPHHGLHILLQNLRCVQGRHQIIFHLRRHPHLGLMAPTKLRPARLARHARRPRRLLRLDWRVRIFRIFRNPPRLAIRVHILCKRRL
mmetsp:Transcript_3333/g.9775  ORF Transcript_3333/g.9775 Transcript_3333/m.9775 type:complete len:350 (+) Transcript_3333:139-1188(+)